MADEDPAPCISTERLTQIGQESLAAAVRGDVDGVNRLCEELLTDGCPSEALMWTIGMVQVAHWGMPRPPRGSGAVAIPGVMHMDVATGRIEHVDIDKAPFYMQTYVRITAAYLNDDRDAVWALWGAAVEHPDQTVVGEIMATALYQAAERYKQVSSGGFGGFGGFVQ